MRKTVLLVLLIPEAIFAFGVSVLAFRLVTVEWGQQLSPVGFLVLIALTGGIAMAIQVNLSMWLLGIRVGRRDGRIELLDPSEYEPRGGARR